MRGLYAILDVGTLSRRKLPIIETARAVIEARPAALQLRAKVETTPREALALLRAILPLCREANVLLFANDRPDLAVLAGCDGVHLGQDDLPIAVARRIAPGLLLGISTHNLQQVEDALRERPDYLAFGPSFQTTSKARPDPVFGFQALSEVSKLCNVPVVAIGGIDLTRAAAIATRADAAAVISALLPEDARADDLGPITTRALALKTALLEK